MTRLLTMAALAVLCACSTPVVTTPEKEEPVNPQPEPDPTPDPSEGKTLVLFYSYTGKTREIVEELKKQISCDVVEVIPEGNYDYNANNYKIGADQINSINANPDKASSYPAVKPVSIDLAQYSTVIVATPLWHARMASNMQALLFQYGGQMAGKRIGLIVSSHSSGISGVESDAQRLVPEGDFTKSLWINWSNHSNRSGLIKSWLEDNGLDTKSAPMTKLNNDSMIPMLGIGTYSLHDNVCFKSVYTALKNGYRLIDTAYMYGNEEEVGKAVRQAVSDGICSREDITVITKLYPGEQFLHPEPAIEMALSKLDIDYIDIMLLHRPGTDDVKAYKAMEKYHSAGKIHALGLSCFYKKELEGFFPQVSIMPVLVQNEIHPYYQDTDVIDFIHGKGIAVQAWYPLGGRGFQKELLNDSVLTGIAKSHGRSVVQIILRWHYQRGVIAIPGSSNPSHIAENISIFDFELSSTEMAQIAALNRNEKHDWY